MSDNGRHEFDATPEGRVAYLESLQDVSEPWVDHTPIFVEYLDDEEPQVRTAALRGLWYPPDYGLIDRIIDMATHDPSVDVRTAAISALGIYIYEGEMAEYGLDLGPATDMLREEELPEADFVRVQDFLLGVYADETRSLGERGHAIESLGFMSDPKVSDLIEEAYHRPEREMKVSAIFAMGRSGMARWTEILGRELYNADQDIQREAIRSAGEIGLTELGQDLWRLTYAEDKDIMLEATDALGQSGWEGAFERLEELTLDPDPEIAEVAEEALDEWLMMRQLLEQADAFDEDMDLDWDQEDDVDPDQELD
jgi:HEAT repeat protein